MALSEDRELRLDEYSNFKNDSHPLCHIPAISIQFKWEIDAFWIRIPVENVTLYCLQMLQNRVV